MLTKVEQECGEEVSAKVVTLNTFPTAAGTCAMEILGGGGGGGGGGSTPKNPKNPKLV